MLEIGETMKRLEAAVVEAREFFGIDPLYRIEVRATRDDDHAADIDAGDGYLWSPINVSIHYYQQHPHLIRQDMAHEVAHLVGNELLQLQKRMPEEWRDEKQPAGGLLVDAIETMTVRLERLFLRERREPTP